MRILMLTQRYSPLFGGIEQHVQTLNTELIARGHDVAVVTQWSEGLAPFEIDHGVRIYRIRSTMDRMPWLFANSDRRQAPPFPDPELVQKLRCIIAQERPQIIHTHNWLGRSFLPLEKWSNARLIVTLHDFSLACATKIFLQQGTTCGGSHLLRCFKCVRKHYGLAKGLPILISNQIVGQIERNKTAMYLPVSETVAINNGLVGSSVPFQIIPNFLQESNETQHVDTSSHLAQLPGEGYLLFVGALGKWKGVSVLLRAYAALKNAPPLVLIGYKVPDWQEIISDLPPHVTVFMDWPHEAVMEAWRRCSIALVPSIAPESFGIVVIEAMSMGKPIIASRMGALPELVVDNETGLLVPPNDPNALQQAIQRLLDNPALLERMGMIAKQRSTQYLASSVVPRIEQIYRNVLAQEDILSVKGEEPAVLQTVS